MEVKYPEEINMDKFIQSDLIDSSNSNIYILYGIIVEIKIRIITEYYMRGIINQ